MWSEQPVDICDS